MRSDLVMSGGIDLGSYLCGGYFLAKRIARPPDLSDPVPDSVITLSNCFTDIAPSDWADGDYNYDDDERSGKALRFGIPSPAVPALVKMFTEAVRPQHLSNSFPSLFVARAFYRQCRDENEVLLLGIGLERSLIPSFRAQLQDDPNGGYGLKERLEANVPLEAGGETLGYEPLGYEGTSFHSWLCHNAPVDAQSHFGIQPNKLGLIDMLEDAVRITRHLKTTGAEPAIWEPWLIVRYVDIERSPPVV
jgi:hypothetical protein